MKNFKARLINHKDQRRIAVEFENKLEIRQRFKKLSGAKWSPSLKVWHLPDTSKYREMFGITLIKHEKLSSEVIESLAVFKKYMTYKRYSENTIKSYTELLIVFFNFFHKKNLQKINNEDVVFFNIEYSTLNI